MASKAKTTTKSKPKVSLEKIVGHTTRHNVSLAVNRATGDYAYVAGACVVIVNPSAGQKQSQFLVSPKPKTLSCLAYSANGKFLAVGLRPVPCEELEEDLCPSGYQPAVLVWDLQQKKIVAELKSHKFGVGCVAFSPNSKWIVSAGFERDQMLEVWDWREQKSLACSKLVSKVFAIDFAPEGTTFVTVGEKHFKFWEFAENAETIKKTEKMHKTQYVLEGRSAGVPEKWKDKVLAASFMDVAVAPNGVVYSVTNDGNLVQVVVEERRIEKLVHLKVNNAAGISLTPDAIAIACSEGLVRMFHPETFSFLSTMPKPLAYGQGLTKNGAFETSTIIPDVLAVRVLPDVNQVVCVYADNTISTWVSKNFKEFALQSSARSHAGCIWDAITLSNGNIVTCSADNTIRFWDLANEDQWGAELRQTITTATDPADLCLTQLGKMSVEEIPPHDNQGIRSMAISPDETHLASGDSLGNLRVHELEDHTCVSTFAAHDGEVLSVHYSYGLQGEPQLLASASRDRLIHVFERTGFDTEAYTLRKTLDDHTSTVVAAKFAFTNGTTRLISCSSDKSLLFRNVNITSPGDITITSYQRDMMTNTAADLEVDPENNAIIAVSSDKKVVSWDVVSGKRSASVFTAETDPKGTKQLKIDFDPSGQLAITTSQDKIVRLYDLEQGLLIAKAAGHADLITTARITRDCERLVTVGIDGCIIVWRLAADLVDQLKRRLEKNAGKIPRELAKASPLPAPRPSLIMPSTAVSIDNPSLPSASTSTAVFAKVNGLKFEVPSGSLPLWARSLKAGKSWSVEEYEKENTTTRQSRWIGRWTSEIEDVGLSVYTALTGSNARPSSRRFSLDKAAPAPLKSSLVDSADLHQFEVDNDVGGKAAKAVTEDPQDSDALPGDEVFSDETPDFMTSDFESFQENFMPKQKPNPSRMSLTSKFHTLPKMAPLDKIKRGSPKPEKTAAAGSPISTPARIPHPPKIATPKTEGLTGTPSRLLQPTNINDSLAVAAAEHPVAVVEPFAAPAIAAVPVARTAAEEEAFQKLNRWEIEVERSRQRLRDLGITVPANPRSSVTPSLPTTAPTAHATYTPQSTPVDVPAAAPVFAPAPTAVPGETSPTQSIVEAPKEVSKEESAVALTTTITLQPESELPNGQTEEPRPSLSEEMEVPAAAADTVIEQGIETMLETMEQGDQAELDAALANELWADEFGELEPEYVESAEDDVTVSQVLSQLKNLFDMSLHLYSISQAPEVQTQFVDLFEHMRSALDEKLPPRASKQTELLERYSELLVDLVKKKMS